VTGQRIYLEKCAACHGRNGNGLEGKFPPLSGVPWVNGSPTRLAALTLDGLTGKRKVDGLEYDGVMPAWRGVLTAPEIAAVLTYLRQTWRNHASAVSTDLVHRVSDRFQERRRFWTSDELQALTR
jgi:mono/diheme cytochrome c family protein